MADIEEALVALIEADAGCAAQFGNRIYPLVLEQGSALSALVYQVISSPRIRSHQGPSGLAYPRVQFTVWASTYLGAKAGAKAVRNKLDGLRGTFSGVRVDGVMCVDQHDDYDAETKRYRRILDAIAWHEET